jgi:hypothetical protein
MTYNLVSVKRVIAKVYTDLGLQEGDVPVSDMIEWSAEALEKIGAPTVLTTKITGKEGIPLTPIVDYQAQLPLDYFSIMQVAYTDTSTGSDTFIPMKYASGSFEERQGMTSDVTNTFISDSTAATSYITTDDLLDLVVRLYDLTYAEALEKLNTEPEIESLLKSLIGTPPESSLSYDRNTVNIEQLEYVLTPGYIKTNVREGYLMIAYKAVPTDEEGFPMVPDNASFIDALYWYINMKIKYMQWTQGKIRDIIYQHAEQKWNFYVKQAYGRAMMPATLDEMESLKNAWMRLLPVTNAGDSFFKYIGQQESLRTYR